VKLQQAKSVIAAVPVASVEAWEVLAGEADEVVCLATPEPFYAVGVWYEAFPQVTDDEVRGMLSSLRRRKSPECGHRRGVARREKRGWHS